MSSQLVHTGQRGNQKLRDGIVVSDKMDKTVVVAVVRQVKDRQYGKVVKRTTRYLAHCEEDNCKVGDVVRIVETRPLSKNKRWRVQSVIRQAA